MRRLPDEHASPIVFEAIGLPLIPAPTDSRLQDDLRHLRGTDMEISRPPGVERFREDAECSLGGYRNM
jgi:hypothetical protein